MYFTRKFRRQNVKPADTHTNIIMKRLNKSSLSLKILLMSPGSFYVYFSRCSLIVFSQSEFYFIMYFSIICSHSSLSVCPTLLQSMMYLISFYASSNLCFSRRNITDSGMFIIMNAAIAIRFYIRPAHKKILVLFETYSRMRGLITRIKSSTKKRYPLISVTRPGKNSIICVQAIMFLRGTELPKMNIVT